MSSDLMVIALLHRLLLSFWHRSMKTVSWVVWGGNSQLPVFSVLKISHYWKYFLHLLSRESEWHENALGCFFFHCDHWDFYSKWHMSIINTRSLCPPSSPSHFFYVGVHFYFGVTYLKLSQYSLTLSVKNTEKHGGGQVQNSSPMHLNF